MRVNPIHGFNYIHIDLYTLVEDMCIYMIYIHIYIHMDTMYSNGQVALVPPTSISHTQMEASSSSGRSTAFSPPGQGSYGLLGRVFQSGTGLFFF